MQIGAWAICFGLHSTGHADAFALLLFHGLLVLVV